MGKILIVEDDLTGAEFIRKQMEERGHTCVVRPTGENILQVIKDGAYELLILDIMLPHTSGFELCRRVRRDADLFSLPILVISAMKGEEEIAHGLAQGADDYIPKPFQMNHVIQRAEALLRAGDGRAAVDAVTGLPGPDTTKHRVQRMCSLPDPFALVYSELVNFQSFGRRTDEAGRQKAVRRLGRTLTECGKAFGADNLVVGHMGGGHFVSITPPDHVRAYAKQVRVVWAQQLSGLYSSVGLTQAPAESETESRRDPPLDVLISITVREPNEPTSYQQLFETISRLRHKARESTAGGIYLDQRTPL